MQHKLTPREIEVYALLCRGYQDKEIGETLNMTLQTVKKHNKNIYVKLGVRNRTEAVIANRSLKKNNQ